MCQCCEQFSRWLTPAYFIQLFYTLNSGLLTTICAVLAIITVYLLSLIRLLRCR